MPPSCLGQEGQALTGLYQRAAFRVKQESGFVFGERFHIEWFQKPARANLLVPIR